MPLVMLLGVSACGPAGLAVGAGAGAGVGMAQERGLKVAAQDLKITVEIMDLWFKESIELPTKVSIEVYEGRALITGAVKKIGTADLAVKLAWQAADVKDVINEVQVIPDSGLADFARDSWVTLQLKTKLTFDKEIQAINYSVETVNGVVFLIGIAQNQAELDRVKRHAQALNYVRDVKSHVRVLKKPGSPS